MEENNKLTIFDYYKNIIRKTPMLPQEEIKKSFDIIGMNKLFSYDKMNCLIANEINDFLLNKWTVYQYYYYGVDQRTYVPFLNLKKEKDDEKKRLMDIAAFLFPEYSMQKLEEVVKILKKDLFFINIDELKDKGGIKKNE
jgi:hypothetical protein